MPSWHTKPAREALIYEHSRISWEIISLSFFKKLTVMFGSILHLWTKFPLSASHQLWAPSNSKEFKLGQALVCLAHNVCTIFDTTHLVGRINYRSKVLLLGWCFSPSTESLRILLEMASSIELVFISYLSLPAPRFQRFLSGLSTPISPSPDLSWYHSHSSFRSLPLSNNNIYSISTSH